MMVMIMIIIIIFMCVIKNNQQPVIQLQLAWSLHTSREAARAREVREAMESKTKSRDIMFVFILLGVGEDDYSLPFERA